MDSNWFRGALLAALGAACSPAREPRYWACDRAAGTLLALDQELCVLLRRELIGARLLCPSVSGGWVACGPERELPSRLARFTPRGEVPLEVHFRGIEALASDGGGHAALVLEPGAEGARRLWRVEPGGARRWLAEFPGPCVLAVRGREILVGRESGEFVLLREDGAVLRSAAAPGPVVRVAPGPRAGTWWSLCGRDRTLVALLDEHLDVVWGTATGLETGRFAPVPREERVWLADAERLRRYGPAGALELELALDASGLATAAVLASDDGVLLLAPGALLEVEVVGGRPLVSRGQGGFAALGDVTGSSP